MATLELGSLLLHREGAEPKDNEEQSGRYAGARGTTQK